MEILLQPPVVEGLERGGIIKILILRVGGIGVLAKDIQLQGIRPPVGVAVRRSVPRGFRERIREGACEEEVPRQRHTECHLQRHCSSCVQLDIQP